MRYETVKAELVDRHNESGLMNGLTGRPAPKQAGNGETLETEGQIAGVAEQRHVIDLEAPVIGNRVFPVGLTLVVPQSPEESALQRCQPDATPVAIGQRRGRLAVCRT